MILLAYIIALPSTLQFTKHSHYFEPLTLGEMVWAGISISVLLVSKDNANDLSKVIQLISRKAGSSGSQLYNTVPF